MENRYLIISALFFAALCVGLGSSFAADIPKRLSDVKRITVAEVQQLQAKESVILIDTRAPGQWVRAKDKALGAIRIITDNDLENLKNTVSPEQAIVTYCT
jgi:hypothetical protein